MKIKNILQDLIQFTLIFTAFICLYGCCYGRDQIRLNCPLQIDCERTPISGACSVNVDVAVYDKRSKVVNVGCKGFGIDYENVGIELMDDLADVISNALKAELCHRNFNISPGNLLVEVEIHKFHNDFKAIGSFTGKAEAELILLVQVKTPSDELVYSRIIIGIGQNEIFLANAKNAKIALNAALNDAINSLVSDPSFFQSLL